MSARGGVRQVPVLLAIALAATGIVALVAFWGYYWERGVGETISYLALFGSVLAIVWSLWGGGIDRAVLRGLATPLGLWALGSLFLIFLGFVHGGTSDPIVTSGGRFSPGPMPSDSTIPFFYAEWFYEHGHQGTAPVFPGEWLSSDRPPLQIGYVLSQRVLGIGGGELQYQVLGVVLQQLWIVGLWALLVAARLGRLTRALAMVAVLVSDLALLNGFFVWPKLLPAAMLLAAAALVLTPLWDELRGRLWGAALLAALVGMAMMGHGSSLFGAIPLALAAAYRGLPSLRWIGVALAVLVVVMVPWSAYQKYGDPPADRLPKWMLGGVVEIDERGTLEAIVDSYRKDGVGGVLYNKASNYVWMVGGGPAVEVSGNAVRAIGDGDLVQADREVRAIFFFYLLPSLGLLLLGPVAMAIWWRRGRERPREWRFALTCFAVAAIGCLAWGLIIYGNLASRTVIHIGSYLIPVLLICGSVCGLRAVLPRFAIWWTGLAIGVTLLLYAPPLEPPAGTSLSPVAVLLAAAGLVGFLWLAMRVDVE